MFNNRASRENLHGSDVPTSSDTPCIDPTRPGFPYHIEVIKEARIGGSDGSGAGDGNGLRSKTQRFEEDDSL